MKVLRLVDGNTKPVMPYIYEVMNRTKEQITTNFKIKILDTKRCGK